MVLVLLFAASVSDCSIVYSNTTGCQIVVLDLHSYYLGSPNQEVFSEESLHSLKRVRALMSQPMEYLD